jgi:hypothetical protein
MLDATSESTSARSSDRGVSPTRETGREGKKKRRVAERGAESPWARMPFDARRSPHIQPPLGIRSPVELLPHRRTE